ncbi:MAG: flavin reductase family protein, partial [Nitrospinales bacterium]
SRPRPSDVKDQDYHHGERVTVDLLKRVLPSNNYDFFICAPPAMVKSLRADLAEFGVPKKNIHFEAFGSETVKKCKVEEKAERAAPIEVTFAKSGKTFPWDSKMNCILDFAEDKGITIDSGCGGGSCGTCQTAVKTGGVNYLKEPGFDPEGGSCLPCISVPKENLTLDA